MSSLGTFPTILTGKQTINVIINNYTHKSNFWVKKRRLRSYRGLKWPNSPYLLKKGGVGPPVEGVPHQLLLLLSMTKAAFSVLVGDKHKLALVLGNWWVLLFGLRRSLSNLGGSVSGNIVSRVRLRHQLRFWGHIFCLLRIRFNWRKVTTC